MFHRYKLKLQVLCNSCNMEKRDAPDIYKSEGCRPNGWGQENHKCLCYKKKCSTHMYAPLTHDDMLYIFLRCPSVRSLAMVVCSLKWQLLLLGC